jgi:hypothetical protein
VRGELTQGRHVAEVPALVRAPAARLERVDEVRRPEDGELCGFVDEADGHWRARTVFGAVLGRHDHREDAMQQVLSEGLAALADRWTLRHGATGEEEVVCIVEANPAAVTVARGYYSLPGVPTLTITFDQIAAGEWAMLR